MHVEHSVNTSLPFYQHLPCRYCRIEKHNLHSEKSLMPERKWFGGVCSIFIYDGSNKREYLFHILHGTELPESLAGTHSRKHVAMNLLYALQNGRLSATQSFIYGLNRFEKLLKHYDSITSLLGILQRRLERRHDELRKLEDCHPGSPLLRHTAVSTRSTSRNPFKAIITSTS